LYGESFGWGTTELGAKFFVFRAGPDDGSEWTSLDRVEFTMFIPENVA
jgi:hypothetical protein